jgi:hypothetical protein
VKDALDALDVAFMSKPRARLRKSDRLAALRAKLADGATEREQAYRLKREQERARISKWRAEKSRK